MNKLKEIREKKGLMIKDACKLIGISACYLSQLENGARQLSSSMLKKVCEGYNVKPNDILDYDDSYILIDETSNEFSQHDIEMLRLIKQLDEKDSTDLYTFINYLIYRHNERIKEMEAYGKKGN